MEPAKVPVKIMNAERYVINTRVVRVFCHTERVYVSGSGPETVFTKKEIGWFMALEGSYEALYMGKIEPTWKPGDTVKITLEKI